MLEKVNKIIEEKVKPLLAMHGGDIELIEVNNGIAYVKLVGACAHCPSSALTLYEGVEKIITTELPEIIGIEQVF